VNTIAKTFGRRSERAAKEGDRELDDGAITFDDGKRYHYYYYMYSCTMRVQ
jgi:hypothetical protein